MSDEEVGRDEMTEYDVMKLEELIRRYGTETLEAALEQIADDMNDE